MPTNFCHLRRINAAQVAAVCFRSNGMGPEFLLVRTDNSKWTFPKGNIDPVLGARISAALEASEEAGVEGIISNEPFHGYLASKGVFWRPAGVREFPILAYLLEVERVQRPVDSFRRPTWCHPAYARNLLAEGREHKYRREFDRLIDLALEAIYEQQKERGMTVRKSSATGAKWTASP